MRLLHTTFMTLSEFIGDSTPEYAILSHTWGEEEVLFLDIINRKGNGKAGYAKLEGCCKKARDDGFEWVWIDTCCINKDSSAELSEAINSMFLWYKSATVCYAYLADISTSEAGLSDSEALRLTQSRWFSRGWTLQELIAPPLVEFYSQEWVDIGTKTSLWLLISQKTGIPKDVLLTGNLSDCNAAAKMSWAASRVTTRSEDMAYCLLGIFDINMPMLYGEGDKAFARLQREIIIQEIDYSIFVWSGLEHQNKMGVLASSPSNFTLPLDLYDFHSSLPDHTSCILDYNDLVVVDPSGQELYKSAKEVVEPPMFTPRGLKMTAPVRHMKGDILMIFLNVKCENMFICLMAYKNYRVSSLYAISQLDMEGFHYETIYIETKDEKSTSRLVWTQNATAFVELGYQQSCERFTISLSSFWSDKEVVDRIPASEMRIVSCKSRREVLSIMSFKITDNDRNRATHIVIIIGQGRIPWCKIEAIHDATVDLSNLGKELENLLAAHLQKTGKEIGFLDRDACYLTGYPTISATVRRTSRRQNAHIDANYSLLIGTHKMSSCPAWVSYCIAGREWIEDALQEARTLATKRM